MTCDFFFSISRPMRKTCSQRHDSIVPRLSERVVHAVEGDVKLLQLGGGETGSPLVEGLSAMKQGNGGEIHRSQFSQTAAHCLCAQGRMLARGRDEGWRVFWNSYRGCRLLRADARPACRAAAG